MNGKNEAPTRKRKKPDRAHSNSIGREEADPSLEAGRKRAELVPGAKRESGLFGLISLSPQPQSKYNIN